MALSSGSWTVTLLSDRIIGKVREVRATLALPTTDTYPNNGVGVPTLKFGFKRGLETLIIENDNTGAAVLGTRYKYDNTLQTIRAFVATTGIEVATTANGDGSGAATTIFVTARGW